MPKGPKPQVDFSGKGLTDFAQKEMEKEKNPDKAQTLFLYKNKLTTLHPSLALFTNLRALFINNNNFTELPSVVCNLPTLEKLHAENNKISKIPPGIGNLQNLKKLYLSENCLEELPVELGNLRALEVLDLHANKITMLPPHLAANERLKELSIFNNPIMSPPPFIVNNGMVHMMMYLKEVRDSLLTDAPGDEFVFQRKVSFLEEDKKGTIQKRTTVAKSMIKDDGIKQALEQASKAEKSFLKENRRGSKDAPIPNPNTHNVAASQDDIKTLSKNHLLYFLTECAAYEEQGRRDYMEDRCVVIPRMRQRKPNRLMDEVMNIFSKVGYFGIYDGHGGAKCAEYMTAALHKNVVNTEAFVKGDFQTALKQGFRQTDTEFLNLCKQYRLVDGSTCCVAMVIDNKLITAHAGDSRAVLCRDKKAIRLTEDHKPERADELARVEELGGEIVFRGNCFRIMGDLAMSRSFGDLRLKEPVPLVISDPEITVEELTPKDEFVIIASDGLWDVLTDQKAVDIVKKCETSEEAARKLVQTALELGTMDNTTAIVVRFNWSLDFLTDSEIQGQVNQSRRSATNAEADKKARIENLIDNEKLERARSNSLSFRDGLEGLPNQPKIQNVNGVYMKVTGEAIMLKILIPAISGTKLLKLDTASRVKDVILMMIKKHRFTDSPQQFDLMLKGTILDANADLKTLGLKDNDVLEMKKKAGTSAELHVSTESPNEKFAEALPPQQEAPAVQEEKRDVPILQLDGIPYVLTDSEWKTMDEKNCKIILYDGGDKFRLVALSPSNQALINAWVRAEYPFNPPKDDGLVSFFSVVSGQLKQFAVKFPTIEEAERFAGAYNTCMNKLKAKIKADKQKDADTLQKEIDSDEKLIQENEQAIAALELKLKAKTEKLEKDRKLLEERTKLRTKTASTSNLATVEGTWKEAKAPDGRIYYYNSKTKETTWTKPAGMA